MQKQAIIYHNPRCSKSRECLAILENQGYKVTEVRYLDNPPSAETLRHLVSAMKLTPLDLVRQKETLFKTLELEQNPPKNDQAWLKIMAENPILIERPIVEIDSKVILGRPPEKLLAFLASLKTEN